MNHHDGKTLNEQNNKLKKKKRKQKNQSRNGRHTKNENAIGTIKQQPAKQSKKKKWIASTLTQHQLRLEHQPNKKKNKKKY